MNNLFVIFTISTFLLTANAQIVQYATRFRNFSIESETNSAHLICFNIYQDKNDHKISTKVNFTKDVHIKNVEVVFNRCSFEKYDCENFQKWKFTRNLKSVAYMENQIWTPIFAHITPKLDIPFIKKNVYRAKDMSIDTKVAIRFYPEAINYFWRVDIFMHDYNDKKAYIMKLEIVIISFVRKDKRKQNDTATETSSVT